MQSVTTDVINAIQQSADLPTSFRVIVEWSHNRYTTPTVDNFGYPEADHAFDLDLYPISSLVAPLRPTAGIMHPRASEGTVAVGFSPSVSTTRSYTVSKDSKYKYWSSPTTSDGAGAISNASPYSLYSTAVKTNKIYLCFENGWAQPSAYTVQITTDGATWTTVATNPAIGSDGTVALYRQANGTWGTTVSRDNPLDIKGIRVNVTSLTKTNSYLSMIEMDARYEVDLSPYATTFSLESSVSDNDFVSPLGDITANSGSVVLWNGEQLFNNDNASSPYYGLIDRNAKFTIDVGVDSSAYGGSGTTWIRQATMYANDWSGASTVTVNIQDASKFLQETFPNRTFMQSVTIGQAIWRLLDSVGFNAYDYVSTADDDLTVIDYFWVDGTKTIWETIQELCRTTQSTAYFNENGRLQIVTRQAAFDKSKSVAWTFDYNQNGSKQPDIADLNVTGQYEANHVIIRYKPTTLAQDDQNRPISEIVWQPGSEATFIDGSSTANTDQTITLRCSPLAQAMDSSQMYFYLSSQNALIWPYNGIVNIGGELIKYDGKEYWYIDANGVWQTQVLHSVDEQRTVDNTKSHPTYFWRNFYSGKMIVTERGYDFTTAISHDIATPQWSTGYIGTAGGTQNSWTGGINHIVSDGVLRIQTGPYVGSQMFYTCPRSTTMTTTPVNIGTRIRFPSSIKGTEESAGFFWYANSDTTDMYAVSICSTNHLSIANRRTFANEVRVMKRHGGTWTSLNGGGRALLVGEDTWYDVQVSISGNTFSVYVNGQLVLQGQDNSLLTATNSMGVYVSGNTVAEFQYFWAADSNYTPDNDIDNSSFLDLINGGYYSNETYSTIAYYSKKKNWRRGNKTTDQKAALGQRFLDEFGNLVHEVREYRVDFDKFPVLYSSLYLSNTSQVVVDEYFGNPFGASFIVANASRETAVISGDDSTTFGSDNTVQQKLLITGRTIQQAAEKQYEVKNSQAIAARGDISLDISSDWIQSEAAAKALGDWIVNNWSDPADTVGLSSFANPLLQIGDLVAVNYPLRNMTAATHKFWVIGINQAWSDGLKTTYTIRRARV